MFFCNGKIILFTEINNSKRGYPTFWTAPLPFGLRFDKKSGILKYKNLHVTLSGQGLKLFTHLINSQQSVIAPQIIYSQILGNALKKEKIGKAERDAVSAAIVRLRESLAPMPFIQIKSCRGTGYQLIISNPEEI